MSMKLKKIFILSLLMLILASCSNQPESAETNVPAANILSSEETSAKADENIEADDDSEDDSKEDINDSESALKDGFAFMYNGAAVYLGEYAERILEELGPAPDYYEMDSCSFEGVAKTYYYGGFDIETYLKTKNGKDRVYSVALVDDSVTTAEGVYIGQTFDNMIKAYGTDYTEIPEIPGFYSYAKGGTVLSFNLQDGIIKSIAYKVADIYN